MSRDELHKKIRSHMNTTRTAYEDGTIDDLRSMDSDKYELIEIEFPFGKRRCLKKKNQEKKSYLKKL